MQIKQLISYLNSIHTPLDDTADILDTWHKHKDNLQFLIDARTDDIPLYVCCKGLVANSFIVPVSRLSHGYIQELLAWNFDILSVGYGYAYSINDEFLSDPVEISEDSALGGSTPVFFGRDFLGYEHSNYVEINQKISHVLDIHWIDNLKAWCSWGDTGKPVPIANYFDKDGVTFCTLQREKLDFYLFLAKSILVQVFEFNRFLQPDFPGDIQEEHNMFFERHEIYAYLSKYLTGKQRMSFLRGFQIIRPSKSEEEMALIIRGQESKDYEKFLIHDWKHNRFIEWTCNPDLLGNYFVPSDLPFEISPAYFNADVLLQYRQDPSRYVIKDTTIDCRHTWSIRYGVNDEGQIFVYIKDLNKLPYREQLRWKSFNEEPKAGIPDHKIKTDFMGEWDESYDALSSLKRTLLEFPSEDVHGKSIPIWKLPNLPITRNLDFLGYVLTESRKEWEDQILVLSQILVEGLNVKFINQIAISLNCRDEKLASVKQLKIIMDTQGVSENTISEIIDPLAELWALRSSAIAHAGKKAPSTDLRQHFREILKKCDISMRNLAILVDSCTFSAP